MKKFWISLLGAVVACTLSVQAQRLETLSNETPEWFKDAKFGIYFHWGVYTVPEYATEWYPRYLYFSWSDVHKHHEKVYGPISEFGYHKLVPLFTAEKFNAKEWVDLFEKAGARFAGPVAEHHDGFAMWDSECTPWNAMDMGPKRDILGEIAKEVRAHNMKLITTFHHARNFQRYTDPEALKEELSKKYEAERRRFYKSHFPYYPGTDPASDDPKLQYLYGNMPAETWYEDIWLGKLKEVIDRYEPDAIWFDSWLDLIPESYRYRFCDYYLSKAKECGKEVAIIRKQEDLPLSISVENLENSRKGELSPRVWETDETISYKSWSYTTDLKIKPASHLIHELIDIVSKNGVLLLNISPRASGEIPANQRKVLLEIGEWLNQNGEAIYGTRPWYTYGEGPTQQPEGKLANRQLFDQLKYTAEDFRFTTKGNTIYVLTLGKPVVGSTLQIQSFAPSRAPQKCTVKQVSLLGTKEKVQWELNGKGLSLNVPKLSNDVSIVYKIEIEK